jgi:hypothetical protein
MPHCQELLFSILDTYVFLPEYCTHAFMSGILPFRMLDTWIFHLEYWTHASLSGILLIRILDTCVFLPEYCTLALLSGILPLRIESKLTKEYYTSEYGHQLDLRNIWLQNHAENTLKGNTGQDTSFGERVPPTLLQAPQPFAVSSYTPPPLLERKQNVVFVIRNHKSGPGRSLPIARDMAVTPVVSHD